MKPVFFLLAVTGCGFEVAGGSSPAGSDGSARADGGVTSADAIVDAGMGDAQIVADAGPSNDAPPPHVCAGYSAVGGTGTLSTYKKFNGGMAWANAKTRCEQDTAYLVIPETMAEATAVYAFISPDSESPYYWAGFTRSNSGVVDLLGRAFPNPPWGINQPNDGATDPILVGSNGAFYDYPAGAPQEFACECAPE